MPNVNLTVPYSAQQAEIDRRRRMAQLLQMQGMEPLTPPPMPGVQTSGLEGLARILQQFIGRRQEGKLDVAERELAGRKQSAIQAEMARLLNPAAVSQTTMRAPSVSPAIPSTEVTSQLPANPLDVESGGLASQFPQVQQMASALTGNRLQREGEESKEAASSREKALDRANRLAVAAAMAGRPGIERISGQMLTADDAQFLADRGQIFKDRQGRLIAMPLPSHMGLSLISGGAVGDPRYEVVTQPTRTATMNNVTSVFPSRSPNAPLAEGVARVPTITNREEIGIDPATGNPVAQELRSTTTPVGQVPSLSGIGRALNYGRTPGQTPITPPAPAVTPPNPQGPRPLAAMPPAEVARQRQIAMPVKTAAVQIFGNPQNPNSESLKTFAHLADNPQSRERIGRAARMILDNMTAAERGGENIGASIAGYGASASTGGIWGWIKNSTGITGKIAAAQTRATDQVLQALSPEEDRYLSRVFAAYGSVSGLRTVTRGSAYRFSIESLERELPILGLNVRDSSSYNTKLGALAEEIATAVEGSGLSKQLLPEQDFFRQQANELSSLGRGRPASAMPTIGEERGGYTFLGGDPANPASWRKK